MSDCEVCLYADLSEPADVFLKEEVLARKPWNCVECAREIPVGTKYQHVKMLFSGEWEEFRTCLVCAEIRAAFYCDGEIIEMFWEQFEEADGFRDLTTGCLSRLKTPEAKAYLIQRWNEWKGLAADAAQEGEANGESE